MIESKKYKILRFTEFSGSVLQICELVSGVTLYEWVKQANLTRSCVFNVMEEILIQLNNSSMARNNPPYGAVTPFSIIISDSNKVFLLDKDDELNKEELLRKMLMPSMKRNYKESYKAACANKDGTKIKEDSFTYGVTLGFIISHTEKILKLSKLETMGFRRIINKCTSTKADRYTRIKDILKELIQLTDEEEKRQRKKTTEVIAVTVCLLVILSLFVQVIL